MVRDCFASQTILEQEEIRLNEKVSDVAIRPSYTPRSTYYGQRHQPHLVIVTDPQSWCLLLSTSSLSHVLQHRRLMNHQSPLISLAEQPRSDQW